MIDGVISANKLYFEDTAGTAKEVGANAVGAFAGEKTALMVKPNGSDQRAQIQLGDLHTGKKAPVKGDTGICSRHSINV
jgi:hypothetical protein